MEQQVSMVTSSPLHPNLYMLLVGPPGTGKSRTLAVAQRIFMSIPEFYIAPTSATFPAMVDAMARAEKSVVVPESDEVDKYNSLYIHVDELGAFIHKWDEEMVKGLSAFYDVHPFQMERRTNELRIKMGRPQLNMVCACTPQDLLKLLPDVAWGQGFMSRTIMIYSAERIIVDDFAPRPRPKLADLEFDLNTIHNLTGVFHVTKAYADVLNDWVRKGEQPLPEHPKLFHYLSRRKVNVYKLSMVSAVDRNNSLVLNESDFHRALGWLVEAEGLMPDIFKAGTVSVDAQSMDEIRHFVMVNDRGRGVEEHRITNFARDKFQAHMLLKVIETMEATGMIRNLGIDSHSGYRMFSAAQVEPPALH
jgi:hypothetical protein